MLQSARLRSLRLAKNYTHQELADALELNVRQVARYESGETDPAGDIVARIAEVFNVTTDYLLGRSDDPKPYLQVDNLSDQERKVLAALRRNDPIGAIKAIVDAL